MQRIAKDIDSGTSFEDEEGRNSSGSHHSVHRLLKKICAVGGLLCLVGLAYLGWYFLELSFDGGINQQQNNYGNDGLEALARVTKYIILGYAAWRIICWGWNIKRR